MHIRRHAAAIAVGISLVMAALALCPAPALAADGQVDVSVPTTVPCFVKHDGTVITPSSWEMKNVGSEEVSLGAVSVTAQDQAISLSASSSVAGDAKSQWFSYENGSFTQAKTGETLAPDASVSVDWSVGKLDATANASTLEAAANGAFALARVDFTFGQKQAFAVYYSDDTAGLYKRLEVPSVGDTFDGRTVTRVITGIEDKTGIFKGYHSLKSVTAVDENIRPKTTESWFENCDNLTTADLAKLNTSGTTNMASTFKSCWKLSSVNIENWNTSSVTNMQSLFDQCFRLTSLDLTGWNVSNVTNTSYMFRNSSQLTSLNVSNWNVSNVTDANHMFYG